MSIRKYYIDLAEGKKKGLAAAAVKIFLFILSGAYLIIVSLRNFLYSKGFILKAKDFKISVISVGNLTWGGTGKTSLVMYLAKSFPDKKTAVLTRGYGQDEVDLLKTEVENNNCRVFRGKDRAKILAGIDKDYNLAILDDAFQHRGVRRDLDIVLINGNNPFGKGLVPFGSLREPASGLIRAQVVVVTHSGPNLPLEKKLKKINPKLKIFYAYYRVRRISDLKGDNFSKDILLDKRLACFSAIAYPQGFLNTLRDLRVEPVLKFIYPDHHDLKQDEFRSIEKDCLSNNITTLVITSKDRSRFQFSTQLSVFIVEADLGLDQQENFLNIVKRCI